MVALGFDPLQVLALTATLPAGKMEREALQRLRLGKEGQECTVLRGPVDRPSIAFTRCFLLERASESNARYALRSYRLLRKLAPSYIRPRRPAHRLRHKGDGRAHPRWYLRRDSNPGLPFALLTVDPRSSPDGERRPHLQAAR